MCDFDEIFPEDDEGTAVQGVDCVDGTEDANDTDEENKQATDETEEGVSVDSQANPKNNNISFNGNNPHKYHCEKCGYTWWETGWVTRCKSFSCTGRAIQID